MCEIKIPTKIDKICYMLLIILTFTIEASILIPISKAITNGMIDPMIGFSLAIVNVILTLCISKHNDIHFSTAFSDVIAPIAIYGTMVAFRAAPLITLGILTASFWVIFGICCNKHAKVSIATRIMDAKTSLLISFGISSALILWR